MHQRLPAPMPVAYAPRLAERHSHDRTPPAAPHLRKDLLTGFPAFLHAQKSTRRPRTRSGGPSGRPFEAMLAEMEADTTATISRAQGAARCVCAALGPPRRSASELTWWRPLFPEFSGFLLFKELSRRLFPWPIAPNWVACFS